MTTWLDLQRELDRWSSVGGSVEVWWRDDDAVSATPAVRRLIALAESSAAPLALAVVPKGVTRDLSRAVALSSAQITVLQHGIAHENHAPRDRKKQELTAAAGLAPLRHGLSNGKSRLEHEFGSAFLPVQVPPWNRIDSQIEALLPDLGFVGLSTFARYGEQRPFRFLPTIDCHYDIFHWRPTRSFKGQDKLLGELIGVLAGAREKSAVPSGPLGLMTHHRWHEESCWDFLDRLYSCLTNHPAVRFLSASDALKAAAATRRSGASGRGGVL
jgi:hypothetical protein